MPIYLDRPARVVTELSREDWDGLCAKMGLPEGTPLRWRAVEDLASDGMLLVVDSFDPDDRGTVSEWHALLTNTELSDRTLDLWPLVLARMEPVAPAAQEGEG